MQFAYTSKLIGYVAKVQCKSWLSVEAVDETFLVSIGYLVFSIGEYLTLKPKS